MVSGTRCRSEREMELQLQIKKIEAQRTPERERWERERERQEWRQPGAPNGHPNGNNVNSSDVNISLPRVIPGDDHVLTFFNTFERTLELHCIDRTLWSRKLVPQLTAKAQKSLRGLSTDECKDYDVVKRNVFSYFRQDANAYLTAFRSQKRVGNESHKMLLNRLRDLQQGFFIEKGINSLEALADSMLQEQLFNALPDQTKKYVCDRQVRTADETAMEADRWFQGTKLTENFHKPDNKVTKPQVSGAFTPRNQGGVVCSLAGAIGIHSARCCQ